MVSIKQRGMGCRVFGAQIYLVMLFMNGAASHAVALMTSEVDRS
jgi:hypothetical protein